MSDLYIKSENPFKFNVVEKFVSIEGEGIRSGYPAVFVRFAGCNLRCSWCDTKYANENPEYEEIDIDNLMNFITSTGIKRVTLTGGEPLIQPYIYLLIDRLISEGFEVNIETNGSVSIKHVPRDAIITMDYKCPSSGMEHRMIVNNIHLLGEKDVIKFVVATYEDLKTAERIIKTFKPRCNIYFSPVFGKIEPREIVKFVLENGLFEARVQLQLHKIIWSENSRGV
ncbi:Radical SAM domain protein [Caldicellulosiruptor kronotskyensis 2002]|uniref:7-carboxy-7-deazaguanine synthase n=1 Tax=Caldicellulosiruptor kronotskyensis (strain DSM 18902 / VKM B-2412 / 2002) TaxID=632348 RepID=E4SHH2_CALK2|nr:putative 7-carboxy-7-deazaguanine synthase QueE [Caldicellulosiruptor kronotskyensis]ADQ47197.1 Radical SAM domain protein [Caldicellulosiruptor kronotskyensis 2002]